MASYTITGGSWSAQPLAAVDISRLVITKANGLGDDAQFFVPVDIEDFTALSRDDDVTISNGGTVLFSGYVDRVLPSAQGTQEGVLVRCLGAGMKLEDLTFTQAIAVDGGTMRIPTVELGWDGSGGRLNIAETLEDIIGDQTAVHGLTAGTILTGHAVTAPTMDMVDASTLQCVMRVLRWVPDAVVWLDHSADTVNITQPANLTTVTVASTGGGMIDVQPAARQRYEITGVRIVWMVTTTVDGVAKVDPVEDTAGGTTGRRVVQISIPISGGDFTILKQEAVTEKIPRQVSDFTTAEWGEWIANNIPQFKDWNYGATPDAFAVTACVQRVNSATKVGLGTIPQLGGVDAYPRQLIGGGIPPWQAGISGERTQIAVTIRAADEYHTAHASVRKIFGASGEQKKTFYVDVQGTDAESITYTQPVQVEGAESPVTGLAAAWWAALNGEAPAFSCVITTDGGGDDGEPRWDIKPGVKLALSGDYPQAASPVQRVVYDVDAGTTSVVCGPQSRLTPADLVELQRAGMRSGSAVRPGSGARRTSAEATGKTISGPVAAPLLNNDEERETPLRSFASRYIGNATVRVSGGRVSIILKNADAYLQTYVDVTETDVGSLASGDTVWLKLTWETADSGVTYEDSNTDEVTVWTTAFGTFAATVLKSSVDLHPATDFWAVRLCTYTVATDVVSLTLHREGDQECVLPDFIKPTP